MDTLERLYQAYSASLTVTTDSRQITPGCIFFAFKGEHFDGNTFVPQALAMGAACCVTTDRSYATNERCVVVDDVLETLQSLAKLHRSKLTIPVIGITGTNGKTTTKELVTAVLSRRYRVHATAGNHNNHLGVPLTILSTPADAELLIVEMGANHPGEIEQLCTIANPDCGLITNVGRAHLEGFGSFEGVVHTKTELYRHLKAVGGTIFVSADNNTLMREAERLAGVAEMPSVIPAYAPSTPFISKQTGLSMVTYGASEEAQVKGSLVGSNPYMKFYFEDGDNVYTVQSQLVGNYNFDNAMAAVCVGRYFGVELFDIKQAIEQYAPTSSRSQFKRTAHNALILDCYNANPTSMALALENFATLRADNRWVVLGGMKELGAESEKEHRKIFTALVDSPFDHIVLIGPEFEAGANGKWGTVPEGLQWYANSEEALHNLERQNITGATILLKGSNSSRVGLVENAL
ncbi:MAG: UDP-N-acetylmuramoyl-tripeptide--D-alanyl-D-alanine ligase [Bacteroidales bacterium]|nr:UDP-N-acetylmuramoyl-tripeptide--D-alanyl-D-alanine ligase [Bacteroidales bacterium]